MVLSHRFDEGRTIPYRTPLRSPSTSEANGRRSGSTALTTAIDARTLSVQRSLDADGAFNPHKRNKSRRTVKLTSRAVEALKFHRKRQNEERLKAARWEDHGL